MASPVNILLRMPNWLGDSVMAMPAVRHIAGAFPEARLYLGGREPFRRFFSDQPNVAGFVTAPASGFGNLLRSMIKPGNALKPVGFHDPIDLGILFTNSLSTAAWMWQLGARYRIGYDRDCRSFLLTHAVPCGKVESSWHFVRYYLWLAKCSETALSPADAHLPPQQSYPGDRTPTLAVGGASREEAAALLRDCGIGEGKPYAVFAPASAYGEVKDWPADSYSRLAGLINRDPGLPVVLTGSAAQREVCERIARGRESVVNLAGRTSLDGFVGLLAGAALFVGGDSGGAHVAGALGLPTAVIFGITNPGRTRPLGKGVRSIGAGAGHDVKLSTPQARERARAALAAITPEQVWEEAREALRQV